MWVITMHDIKEYNEILASFIPTLHFHRVTTHFTVIVL